MLIGIIPACDTAKKQLRTEQERKPVEERETRIEKKEAKTEKGIPWKGGRYVGETKKGKPHGKGILYILDKNGNVIKTIEGTFVNGEPVGEVVVSEFDSKGRLISKYTGTLDKNGDFDRGPWRPTMKTARWPAPIPAPSGTTSPMARAP